MTQRRRGADLVMGMSLCACILWLSGCGLFLRDAPAQKVPTTQQYAKKMVQVCLWYDCKPAAASWSCDDSRALCFAELEKAHIKGTFYLIGYAEARNAQEFPRFHAAGHELAAHTMHHHCGDRLFQGESDRYAREEVEPNIRAIEGLTHRPVLSVAWPCGCVVPDRIKATQQYVLGARGFYEGPGSVSYDVACNQMREGFVSATPEQWYNLPSYANETAGIPFWEHVIDQAIREERWLIVTAHTTCNGIAELAARQADLWIAPIGEILRYISVRDRTIVEKAVLSEDAVVISVRHTLRTRVRPAIAGAPLLPIVYDNVVTLAIEIPSERGVAGVLVDRIPYLTYRIINRDSTQLLLVDLALDHTRDITVCFSPRCS